MRNAGGASSWERVSVMLRISLALAMVIGTPQVAGASLFLIFDRVSGRPGTVVHVRTGGKNACVRCPHRMPLYFVEAALAYEINTQDDPRLVRVGQLLVDEEANGSGALTVPDVPAGPYLVMTPCEPCAPTSGGRVILPVGPFPPFRVIGRPADSSAPLWPWIAGGLAVLAAATVLARISVRRGSRRPPSRRAIAGRGTP